MKLQQGERRGFSEPPSHPEGNKNLSRRETFGVLAGMFLAMRKSGEAQTRDAAGNVEKGAQDYRLNIPDRIRLDVQRLKIYLNDERVQKLLSSIESKIKPVPTSFPDNFSILIDSVKDLEAREKEFGDLQKELADKGVSEKQKGLIIKILEKEQTQISQDYASYARVYESLANGAGLEQQAKKREGTIAISGFEMLAGMSNKEVASLLSKLPKNLYSDIKEIRYRKVGENGVAGEADNRSALFTDSLVADKSAKIITLKAFEGIGQETKLQHAERLVHELAHLGDWKNSIHLEMVDRLVFYNEIIDVLLAGDRSHDWYIDDYLPKTYNQMSFDTQGERERYLHDEQITELWAQLVSRYFIELLTGKPGRSSDKLSDKERLFTEKWLKKMGIEFKKNLVF